MLWTKRLLALFLLLLAPIAGIQALTPLYKFEGSAPFSGQRWFNPFSSDTLTWTRANFHIHSRTWGGITNGHHSPSEIIRAYDSLGYRWIGIADYQRINSESPILLYEHGWSIGKVHQLCFWPESVRWWDYPLLQTLSAKQHTLRILRPTTPLLVIAHPRFLGSYTGRELSRLGGYDAIEVLNRYGDSIEEWDSALSSGHFTPIIASDNAHDVYNPHEVMSRWTEVAISPNAPIDSLRAALYRGRTVGYKNRTPYPLRAYPTFRRIELVGETLFVETSQPVDSLRIIGQNGHIRAVSYQTDKLIYSIRPADTYLRAEAYTSAVEAYTSPLVRGVPKRRPIPNIDWGWTGLHGLFWGGIAVFLIVAGLRLIRAKQNKQVQDRFLSQPLE